MYTGLHPDVPLAPPLTDREEWAAALVRDLHKMEVEAAAVRESLRRWGASSITLGAFEDFAATISDVRGDVEMYTVEGR